MFLISKGFIINKDMVIKLYIDYVSQPSRSVLAFCILAKIPHQVIKTNIVKGETRTPQFIKINPMMIVPAIVDTDNGLALSESHAILKYLAQKFDVAEEWYPRKDLAKQAKVNQFMDFHHLSIRKCAYLAFHILFAPVLKKGDPTFNKEWTYRQVRASLRNFQDIYLKDSRFVGGDKPCIGDLIAIYDVAMLEVLQFDYSKYPKIVKWMEEMRKIDAVRQADVIFQKNSQRLKQVYRKSAKL